MDTTLANRLDCSVNEAAGIVEHTIQIEQNAVERFLAHTDDSNGEGFAASMDLARAWSS